MAGEPCAACGNCDRLELLDDGARLMLRKILSGIARAGERYGRRKIAAMLVGHLEDLPDPLTRLSTAGLLRDEDPRAIERWIEAASAAGLVRESDDRYRTLSLTLSGREVMAGRVADVRMAVPLSRGTLKILRGSRVRGGVKRGRVDKAGRRRADAGTAIVTGLPVGDAPERLDAVVEALRAWRQEEARRRAIAPFVILHDRTLVAIATFVPRSKGELHTMPGIGPAKLATYGDAILSVVAGAVGRPHP